MKPSHPSRRALAPCWCPSPPAPCAKCTCAPIPRAGRTSSTSSPQPTAEARAKATSSSFSTGFPPLGIKCYVPSSMMQSVEPRASTLTAAAWHIGRVKSKLASGAYPTEATFCLCGHPDAVPVAERDRYGIPHTMVLCTGCGLIRANPRMTQAAYRSFYETEYRPIYDGWEFGPHPSDAVRFAVKGLDAEGFREFLDFFDAKPELVFDFGCGGGELIECLRTAGMQCVGVDFFPGNGNGVAGGIEGLGALGKKGGLIVLQPVVEHLNEA